MSDVAPAEEPRKGLPHQARVAEIYNDVPIQVFVACLIGANFLTNIVEKEIDPKGTKYEDVFAAFGLLYNIAFTIELAVNMYAHWWCMFWKSGWNVFDFVVVSIGLVNMAKLPLPPAFSMLRMMRAFRVFRLFKRVKSLNKIIVAIVHAVPGVMNAFLILFIVMSIYAILAVEFYTHTAENCNSDLPEHKFETALAYKTPRGGCWGSEYFGTFSRSIYTFFQVLTGESWVEMVARPAIWYYSKTPILAVGGGFFFVSYVLITAFMLINVVVAVLLDKMSAAQNEEEEEAVEEANTNGTPEPEVEKPKRASMIEREADKLKDIKLTQDKVNQLVRERKEMREDLDAFRRDMAEMKPKLAQLLSLLR